MLLIRSLKVESITKSKKRENESTLWCWCDVTSNYTFARNGAELVQFRWKPSIYFSTALSKHVYVNCSLKERKKGQGRKSMYRSGKKYEFPFCYHKLPRVRLISSVLVYERGLGDLGTRLSILSPADENSRNFFEDLVWTCKRKTETFLARLHPYEKRNMLYYMGRRLRKD
jgi:hypothetical protein